MKILLIGAVALTAVVPALAQTVPPAPPAPVTPYVAPVPPAPPAPPVIDRVQTRAEVVAKVREHFNRVDANRDGFLTKEEVEAGHSAMKAARKADGIGHTLNVKRGDASAMFDTLDINRDGAISRDEFAKAHEMRAERRFVMRDGTPGRPEGKAHGGMRMHRMGGIMGGHMFEMSDANKDGRVSLQEATDAAARHFDMADVNRDGQLTREERRQMHRQMIVRHRAPKAG